MEINEKETTYESGVIDNLFKIGDKLVALRDNKPDNFNKAINYIVSELHAYNSVIDYHEVSQALKQKYNSRNKIDRNTPFILRGFPLLNTTLMRSGTKKERKKNESTKRKN
jgi:hypothetical protein